MNQTKRKTFNPPLKVFSVSRNSEAGKDLEIENRVRFTVPGMTNAVANERVARYFRKPHRANHRSLTTS